MLLSIVLMIKNEEKFLGKTLKALDKIRTKINTELIILDTGSTDKSVEIAKLYTDKIYFEKWNDNFAEMRNKSISYAKGDWILILDADEELLECERMIDFFKSQLYKEYNCASVELKNINSEDGNSYSKSLNLRLFKNKDFRYEGAIHEQPMYKDPVYNNIAVFNHYGYLYIDEEFKQKKLERNEKILLKEIKKDPKNPYINFQLAKNFMALNYKEEALSYMEKAMKLYRKFKCIPEYVYSNLARFYVDLGQFDKCENVCIEYIQKKDDKNIDIYYFLAVSQGFLYKYTESLNSYKRYIYLVDNYDKSTQANSVYADGITIGLIEYAQIGIARNYYYLGKYEEVVNKIKKISLDEIKNLYDVYIISLCKTNNLHELLNIYKNKLTSYSEKKQFKDNTEKIILKLSHEDRQKLYKILSEIDDNYGVLNKVRLGLQLSVEECNNILTKESDDYYGELIYFLLKEGCDLIEILDGVHSIYIDKYILYLVQNKKDIVSDICTYVIDFRNTLNINKLNIITCVIKNLIKNVDLSKDKYKWLFLMYINYEYECIKFKYNNMLSDEQILKYIKDEDEKFIINFNLLQFKKNNDKLQYIKSMKSILIENPIYKDGIEIFIDELKKEINEANEINRLKESFRDIIKKYLNNGKILEADMKITDYKKTFGIDAEIINLSSILEMMKGNFVNADNILKKAYLLDKYNYDVIFNIACIKEILGEYEESISFLNNIVVNCENQCVVLESKEKIKNLREGRV